LNTFSHACDKTGFTLVELLAVIAVITLLAGLAATGFRSHDGLRLRSAQEILIAQVQAARNLALARNASARLLIDAGNDRENGRRRLAIAVKSDTGGAADWEVVGSASELPDGTAVLVDDGGAPASTIGGSGGSNDPPAKLPGSSLQAPESMRSRDWYYLEFDAAGTCEENAGAILVVGSALHDGTRWTRKNASLIRGVMIRRAGHASAFDDPSHIGEAYNAL
jgi:prepilin-type N-terminal cleavage/methylation domain-containing protein